MLMVLNKLINFIVSFLRQHVLYQYWDFNERVHNLDANVKKFVHLNTNFNRFFPGK